MNRVIVYVGAIPQDTDLLLTGKHAMIGSGWIGQAIVGIGTLFSGLACTPTGPAGMTVNVAPGCVFSQQNVDNSAYGSLTSDTTHQIVKVGINIGTLNFSCPAPATSGQSVVYLIEAAFSESDTGSTVLPYYNAANPSSPYAGPSNLGTSQNTIRQDICSVQVKAGVPATTGTQVTPSPDAGYTGLWTVTVANGQTSITSGSIAQVGGAPFISETLTQKISQTTGDARYVQISNARMLISGTQNFYVATSGNDSTGNGTSGLPWLTMQHAYNVLAHAYDLNGQTVNVNVAAGTYAAGVNAVSPCIGGTPNFIGDTTTPTNVVVSSTAADCFSASFSAKFNVAGFKVTTTAGYGVNATQGGNIIINGNMNFGACSSGHIRSADAGSYLEIASNYTISGSAPLHLLAQFGGSELIYSGGQTVTLSGSFSFTSGFAVARHPSTILTPGVAYSGGTITGTSLYFSATANGVIDTSTGSGTFFPGNTTGVQNTGGQYL